MTAKEGERLATMEQKQADMASTLVEIKQMLRDQNKKFDDFVTQSERRFLTRLEAKVAGALITFMFAAISVYFTIKDHIK